MVKVTMTFQTKVSGRCLTHRVKAFPDQIDWQIRVNKQYGWQLIGFQYEWEVMC